MSCCRLRGLAKLAPHSGLDAVATELGNCVADIVLAALEAAVNLQDALLTPAGLGVGNGETYIRLHSETW